MKLNPDKIVVSGFYVNLKEAVLSQKEQVSQLGNDSGPTAISIRYIEEHIYTIANNV